MEKAENGTGREIIVTTEAEDIKIPKELDDRLNMRLRKLKRKGKTLKLLSYLGTAATFLILSTAIVTINPNLRSFAEKVPVISTIVNSFYKDDSIEQAKNKGFIKMTNFVKDQDGFSFEIDELYFDGLRFSVSAKIHGNKLNEYLKTESNPLVDCNYLISTSKVKENNENIIYSRGLMSELFKVREGNENYIYSRAEKVFTESELNHILKNNNQFEVNLWFRGKNIDSQLIIPVTLDNFAGIKKEEKNIDYSFNNDSPIKDISIEKIISSPTLSQMYYSVNMKENTDFLGFLSPYILDTEGKKYNGESGIFRPFLDKNYVKEGKDEFTKLSGYNASSNFEAAGKLKLNITPSFYLDNITPDKFCSEGVNIKQRKKFNLNMKDKFPQTITFDNKIINIVSADYNDQKLIIKLDKSSSDIEHLRVSYGDLSDLESKETYTTEGSDNTYFTISSNKTDKDGNKVILEKKDTYTITIEAEYIIHKKLEILLNK